jgi:hypothetical protein
MHRRHEDDLAQPFHLRVGRRPGAAGQTFVMRCVGEGAQVAAASAEDVDASGVTLTALVILLLYGRAERVS